MKQLLSTLVVCMTLGGGFVWADLPSVQLNQVYEHLTFDVPVAVAVPDDGTKRTFIVQQRGKIVILPADREKGEAKTFLDISGRDLERHLFEEGLLGLTFHPDFKTNRKFYIYYSMQEPKRTRVSEMMVSKSDPDVADVHTERVLMEIPQPFWNHNSGNLLFGPDGLLYIGVGDGGKANDVRRLAQNPWMLNGKILRIDVNTREKGYQYGIPSDNPWVGQEGVREEVYATGLRNPWGLSFDADRHLWCADVGQSAWEEVNIIECGGNYGWSYREGTEKFKMRNDEPEEGVKFIDPIHQYGRTEGISITGGVVYKGDRFPALKGRYIYADWGTGRLWALQYDHKASKVVANDLLHKNELAKDKAGFRPSAIGVDGNGHLLLLSWNGKLFDLQVKK